MRGVVGMLLIAGFVAAGGCSPPAASEGGFDSDDPGSQLYAIHRAGEQRDPESIPHLIQALDSDDMAVRMYAIGALERITGTRKGYVYYAPQNERTEAIDRWVAAYDAGELDEPGDRAEANR